MTKEHDALAPEATPAAVETLDLAAALRRIAMGRDVSWIWDLRRLAIVEASSAALRFWGVADRTAAAALHFPADDAMARALAEADAALAQRSAEAGPDGAALAPDAGRVAFSVLRETDAAELRARLTPVDLGGDRRGLLVQIVDRPGAVAPPATLGDRAAALVGATAAALAVCDADGVLLWRNPAAERLFGGDAVRFDDLFGEPSRGAALRRAALVSGAARRVARLRTLDADGAAAGRRRDVVVSRLAGLETGEWELAATFLGPVAPPATGVGPDAAASALDAARERALGMGRLIFDADALRLQSASDGAAALLGLRLDRGPTIWELFPADAPALERALDAARAGRRPARVDLTRVTSGESGLAPGPWFRAALTAADAVVLDLCDLSAERRSLVRLKLDADERAAALDALGVGFVRLDGDGLAQDLDAAAARVLGVGVDEMIGREAAASLDETTGRRLTRYLQGGPIQEGRQFEAGATGAARATGAPLRLATTPPTRANQGRRMLAMVAAAPSPPPPAAPSGSAREGGGPDAARWRAVRTELTTVRGFAELMRDDPEKLGSPLFAAYLDDMVEAVGRVTALLDDSAPIGPEAAAPPPAPGASPMLADAAQTVISLARLVRDVADTLAIGRRPDEAPVIAVAEVDPARPTSVTVGDRAALRELIETVIGLAPPADRGRLQLTLHPQSGAGAARLEVAGMGEAAEDARALRVLELLAERLGAAVEIGADGALLLSFRATD